MAKAEAKAYRLKMKDFLEEEAQLGSDDERHDHVVKKIADSDKEDLSDDDLDKDLEGLIDNDEEISDTDYLRVLDKVRK